MAQPYRPVMSRPVKVSGAVLEVACGSLTGPTATLPLAA